MEEEKCSFRHHTLSESSDSTHISDVTNSLGGASPLSTPRLHIQTGRAGGGVGGGGGDGVGVRWPPSRPAWEAVYLLPTRVATAVLALIQGLIIDCYLIRYKRWGQHFFILS
jgi:hypothetical protein